MLSRLIYFVIVLIAVCLVAYVLDIVVIAIGIVPGAIAHAVHILIWGVAILIILWYAWRTFGGSIPEPPA